MKSSVCLVSLMLASSFLFAGAPLAAGELLPADRSIPEVIDHYLDLKLKHAGAVPAAQADDATLVRRLMLDLGGRIPTVREAKAYVESTDPQKRRQLAERLLTSQEYVAHSATEFDIMLRAGNDRAPSVRDYLLVALKENRPWDQMFREMMGEKADSTRPENFVLGRLEDVDALTREVSSVFFGINISCAQCHRHPYVKSLTQDSYFGMRAFFSRSYEFQGQLLEKEFGIPAQYKSKNGAVREVGLLFLTGAEVAQPSPNVPDLPKAIQEENKRIEELRKNFAKAKELPPRAAFGFRAQLVDVALRPENRELFARSIVNRLWYRFYGHGLVMRVDQMHAQNAPSHAELLDWLARDLISHSYDLRRLVRGLVDSRAYARSSRWDGSRPPAVDLFAVANLRPLTPMQYGTSQLLASNPDLLTVEQSPEQLQAQSQRLESEAQKWYGKFIEVPQEGMVINVNEALRLSNDAAMLKLLGEKLVPRLMKLEGRGQQISTAVWTVLSRAPTEKEAELLSAYIDKRQDRPQQALQQMVWALLNCSEFRFNH
ncbi:MAG: DUF1549 and DUF1553 domain-containing protein [Gemmataceae bacterium]|nr:DUF1549 and DUF1553 domain-containing protein [Gemmataceae bacterium]